jgi:hypothetical protein
MIHINVNLKMILKYMGICELSNLAEDRDHWQAAVNTVVNSFIPQNVEVLD